MSCSREVSPIGPPPQAEASLMVPVEHSWREGVLPDGNAKTPSSLSNN